MDNLLYINNGFNVYNEIISLSGSLSTNINNLQTSINNLTINDTNLQTNINTVQNNLQSQITTISTQISNINSNNSFQNLEVTNNITNHSLSYIDMKTSNSDYDVRFEQSNGDSSNTGNGDLEIIAGSVLFSSIFVNFSNNFTGYYYPRYKSSFVSVISNSIYTFTLNFSYTLETIPIHKLLFSTVSNPSFGDQIYDITNYGTNYGDNNGYYLKYKSYNTIEIKTANIVGQYYTTSNQQVTSGYYKLICY